MKSNRVTPSSAPLTQSASRRATSEPLEPFAPALRRAKDEHEPIVADDRPAPEYEDDVPSHATEATTEATQQANAHDDALAADAAAQLAADAAAADAAAADAAAADAAAADAASAAADALDAAAATAAVDAVATSQASTPTTPTPAPLAASLLAPRVRPTPTASTLRPASASPGATAHPFGLRPTPRTPTGVAATPPLPTGGATAPAAPSTGTLPASSDPSGAFTPAFTASAPVQTPHTTPAPVQAAPAEASPTEVATPSRGFTLRPGFKYSAAPRVMAEPLNDGLPGASALGGAFNLPSGVAGSSSGGLLPYDSSAPASPRTPTVNPSSSRPTTPQPAATVAGQSATGRSPAVGATTGVLTPTITLQVPAPQNGARITAAGPSVRISQARKDAASDLQAPGSPTDLFATGAVKISAAEGPTRWQTVNHRPEGGPTTRWKQELDRLFEDDAMWQDSVDLELPASPRAAQTPTSTSSTAPVPTAPRETVEAQARRAPSEEAPSRAVPEADGPRAAATNTPTHSRSASAAPTDGLLTADPTAQATPQAVDAPAAPAAPSRPLVTQLVEHIRMKVEALNATGGTDLQQKAIVEVTDPKVGRIRLEIQLSGQKLQVHVVDPSPEVQALLQGNQSDLQQHLARKNIDLESFTLGGGDRDNASTGRDAQRESQGRMASDRQADTRDSEHTRKRVHQGVLYTVA